MCAWRYIHQLYTNSRLMNKEQIFILAVGYLNSRLNPDLSPIKKYEPNIGGIIGNISFVLVDNHPRVIYRLFITHQGDDYNRKWYDKIKLLDNTVFQVYCVGITKLNILDVFGQESRDEILDNYNKYSKT